MLPKMLSPVSSSISKFSLSRVAVAILSCALTGSVPMLSQAADSAHAEAGSVVANRLTAPIVESSRVKLLGSVHPLANSANDRGPISSSTRLDRLQIVLKRSPSQEAGLKRLITDLHAPGTASYHKWLTPDQFGKQFGPSDADVATLQSWLQAKGFSITKLAPGRQVLEISGTAGQLQNTFHTQMHQYSVAGVTRYANASAPDIPAALSPVFGGFVSLNNFRFKSHSKVLGKAQFNATTHESKPDWTIGNGSNYNLVFAPGDFAVQYDLNPVYTAGTKGDGQAIAIVNESNINIANVNNYRTLFGLPANPPQVIIDGSDPGVDGINSPYGPNYASVEAYLDVEIAGSVAPNAQVDLVIANDTAVDNGLTLAMEHAVYANVAPIVSLSFGGCEESQGSFNTFITALWEQAAAQGQTVLVSTGDNGSAGCDNDNVLQYAVKGQAVNGLASTPYNVAVGGTDFYYSGGTSSLGNYWNLTPSNTAATVSLLTPAPEQPWNDSQYGLNLFSTYDTNGTTSIAAGSGGASTLGVTDSNGNPASPHPKPSWQTGTGVPADGARDLPDVSLFAANGENNSYYPLCAVDADCQPVSSGIIQISGVGGTSASTPAFAGMMALINQKYGRQGQAGYVLYPLAAQFPASFHDVTVGTNSVPCAVDTTSGGVAPKQCKAVASPLMVNDDTNGSATEGEISVDGTNAAYNAGTGYDLATGLGTVDASNLITNWGKITLAASATTLTPSATSFAHGTAVTMSGTVTGSPTPTGDVSLLTTSTDINNQGEDFFTLSAGAYSGSVNYLPGGSYNIYGYYAGNGTVGPSTSTPIAITVTPETSATVLGVYNSLSSTVPIASGATLPYGAITFLKAVPGSTNSTNTTTAATGSVSFLDGSTSINTSQLNANGYAQYNGPFGVGSHTITAKYSGDGSYSASTSAATSFTVSKNSPSILQTYTNQDQNGNPVNGQVTYLTIQVENSASVNGMALSPTGTITVTGAPTGTNTSATLVSGVDPYNNSPQGTAIFAIPATASGNYTLTFNYAGDANYAATSAQPTLYTFDTGAGTTATTTTATASAAATSPTSLVSVTATVKSAGSSRPTGTVYLIASEYIIASATLPAGTGNSASLTFNFDSAALFQGTNQITVQYIPGTSSSFGSSATTVTIANPLSDFAMVPTSNIVSVPGTGAAAGTQTDVINLSSTNGFAGAVSLTCSAASGVTCSISPTAATLASGGQSAATLTVNTLGVSAAGSYNVLVTGKNSAGTVIHTLGLTVVTPLISANPSFSLAGTALSTVAGSSGTSTITATPAGGFTGTITFTCAVTSSPSGATGAPTCSVSPAMASITGTAAATSTLTVATSATTTAGSYVVTVTGTSGSLTATTPIAVTVTGVASPSFTLTGTAPAAIAAPGDSTTSTITVTPTSGFIGAVTLTCAVTTPPTGDVPANDPTCSAASASVTTASPATATLTINTTSATTAGTYTLTVTGTSGSTTASTTIAVTVTAAAAPSFTLAGTAVTIASQGATGTSTITVTPANAFTGTVTLTCAVTSAPSGAITADNPTCSASSASVTSASAATATLTINTTAQSAKLELPFSNSNRTGIYTAGGATLAAILLLCVPFGRRRSKQLKALRGVRILSLAILFALAAGAAIGCGSGSSTPPPAGGGTTTGAYTLTVTGTSGSTTASTTITVTVN